MVREERLQAPRYAGSSSRMYAVAGGSSMWPRQQQMYEQPHQRSFRETRKPPEPLRRAVADCLSSPPPHAHGIASSVWCEAARTLRDYMAAAATTDMAFGMLLEYTIAERDRSPAVVPRCVALLKRYLLRYIPKPQTLQQIDAFCANAIAECYSVSKRRVSSLSSLQSNTSSSAATSGSAAFLSPASNYASASLVKSLIYVRSLVARHISKLSFQPLAFPGASNTLRQSLLTLSSLLSKSFNSQLSPEIVNVQEPSKTKEAPSLSALSLSNGENVDTTENSEYIMVDLFHWRWHRNKEQSPPVVSESGVTRPRDLRGQGFLELGAAALLLGDMEAESKGLTCRNTIAGITDIDQLLQPSTVTAAASFDSAQSHLTAITASKRVKPTPDQIWMNVPGGTFHPKPRTLFQYRCYSEQQPLRLNHSEVSDVVAAVCSEPSPANSGFLTTLHLSNPSGKPSTDVAVSVLIKLVIDMYMMDSGEAAPLILFMLEDMLSSSKIASRVRAFDVILNLGIHAQLLEPMLSEDPSIMGEESATELSLNNETLEKDDAESIQKVSLAIDKFESWLLVILYEVLFLLVQKEEKEEVVWASALSCLFFFLFDKARIRRRRLDGLDIRVIMVFLDISREHSWAEIIHCKLICILSNMFYQAPAVCRNDKSETPMFLTEKFELVGEDFICLEYAHANLREEKQNLFLVLFDYAVSQINGSSGANGGYTYNYNEIQQLAAMLTLADAPEAFYIAVKHGVEGIGEILRRSVSSALSRYLNYERLNVLLEKVSRNLDAIISSFTRLDTEFLPLVRVTKSYKSLNIIEDGTDISVKIRLSWTTLHSLLHSERSAYRHNGYIWLLELLLVGITEGGVTNVCSNLRTLQQQIDLAGSQDLNCLSVPLPVSLMCGLLKSKHNFVRWGFLFLLEKILMRCKLLLDENKTQHNDSGEHVNSERCDRHLEEANALVDLMSSGLALLVQINEIDRINILKASGFGTFSLNEGSNTSRLYPIRSAKEILNLLPLCQNFLCNGPLAFIINSKNLSELQVKDLLLAFPINLTHLKMCEILFSQLSLRVLSPKELLPGDIKGHDNFIGFIDENKVDVRYISEHASSKDNFFGGDSPAINKNCPKYIYDSSSMAALLLRGFATVPMQLVSRVPSSLLYWPLIQLADAATDDIALGVAVGSKGKGNLPGAGSDIRAALLLLLIGKCTADSAAFSGVGGKDFFRELLDDTDSRVAYYSSAFLLKEMMTKEPEKYQRLLQSLIFKAQQSNNEKLLENPYLQMRGILQLLSDLGAQL